MEKKKHICMIAYTIYPTDARVRREAETLASRDDCSVIFLSLMEGASPQQYLMQSVNVREMKINKYRGKNALKYLFAYLRFLVCAFMQCSKLFFQGRVDVVHVHNMPNFIVFSALLPKLLGKKVILDVHDSMPETYVSKFPTGINKYLFKLFCFEERICCRFADRVICVHHVQRDLLASRGVPPDKISVLINVPDHRIFSLKTRDAHGKPPDNKFSLVYHGTITKRLGVDLALEAFKLLSDKIPGLEFYILGSGDDRDAFAELCRKLGISEKIHFNQGMIAVDKLPAALSGMNLGVVSNRRDIATDLMLPVKLLEYISLDIPVVVPRLKTIEHYFTDAMVTFFEPDNINSLADAIFSFYQDKARGPKQAAAARKFLEQYGWEKHQYDLINLYGSI